MIADHSTDVILLLPDYIYWCSKQAARNTLIICKKGYKICCLAFSTFRIVSYCSLGSYCHAYVHGLNVRCNIPGPLQFLQRS